MSRASWHQHGLVRWAWCVLGAACGIGLALAVVGPPHHAFVLASLGAARCSCSASRGHRPRNCARLLGGHVLTASVGIALCAVAGQLVAGLCRGREPGAGPDAADAHRASTGRRQPGDHGLRPCLLVGAAGPGAAGSGLPAGRGLGVEPALPRPRALPGEPAGAVAAVDQLGRLVRSSARRSYLRDSRLAVQRCEINLAAQRCQGAPLSLKPGLMPFLANQPWFISST